MVAHVSRRIVGGEWSSLSLSLSPLDKAIAWRKEELLAINNIIGNLEK